MTDAWTKQVEWMRANGVVRAEWERQDAGAGMHYTALVRCELGPVATPETQPMTAEEIKDAEAEQKRVEQVRVDELDFAAS